MLLAHLVSHSDVHTVCHGTCVPVHAGGRMRKLELKRITAALRHLTPDQRKNIAVKLAALDAQPASTVFMGLRKLAYDVHI